MFLVIAILVGLAGLALAIFGIGYAAVFLAGRAMFDRALASETADVSRAYVESANGKNKSGFVRRHLSGKLGAMAGAAAVSFLRGQLSSGVQRGWLLAGAGLACIVLAFFVPGLLAGVWPK